MAFRRLIYFFFHQPYRHLNHGGRLINPYDLRDASDEEKVLILSGVARSPDDAHYLLKRHTTQSAGQVLNHVVRRKRNRTFHERLIQLIRRIDGHDPRHIYGSRYESPTIRVQYRYRVKK